MTIDELLAREGIRQTMANYTMAGDRLRTDDFIAVFTENGILESEACRRPTPSATSATWNSGSG